MLKFLSIRDFVIVDSLELEFAGGFTALTGETGAGKSILIDALSLALGARGDAGMVRNGAVRAEISAEFDIDGLPQLQAWLKEQAFENEGCLFRRVLEADGRTRGFINGCAATQQQMRAAAAYLLDIHGQHAHQSLLRAEFQRELLDGYAGLAEEAAALMLLYRDWQVIRRRRAELQNNEQALAAERDLLLFQQRELKALDFNGVQWEELQAEHARLSHAASLLETAQSGVELLSESEGACLTQLNLLIARVEEGANFDASLREVQAMLNSARNELQEAVYALRRYPQKLDADPVRLAQQERRIADVVEMARKYRVAVEELPGALERIDARLDELGGDVDLEALAAEETAAFGKYLGSAKRLSAVRVQAAKKMSREISDAMQTLAMQGGRFEVALIALDEGGAHGLEAAEFQVATNPGTPLRDISKVASGGELSRISLAIQVAASQVAGVPTLIFDEVDSGIGGRVAEIVGALLKQLGRRHQVMCVTHLPQVAAQADSQWQVKKAVKNGATGSSIAVLSAEERIEEIARMLGGVKITETTRKHAAEMLGQHDCGRTLGYHHGIQ